MSKSKAEAFQAKVEFRSPESLTPYLNNAKNHSTEQIDAIAGLIHAGGFDVPIVVDKHGVIIKGHGRREASIRLGLKSVPVIVREDLDEHQAMAMRIADNRVAEGQTYDKEKLAFDIGTLSRNDFDLALTGIDDDELKGLLSAGEIALSRVEPLPNDGPPPEEMEPGEVDEYADAESRTGEEVTKSFNINYTLVFSSLEEQQTWFDFLGLLKSKFPELETVSSRLVRFIGESAGSSDGDDAEGHDA